MLNVHPPPPPRQFPHNQSQGPPPLRGWMLKSPPPIPSQSKNTHCTSSTLFSTGGNTTALENTASIPGLS